jgi:pimeloyl-ACP methyl ester carboxylesterase
MPFVSVRNVAHYYEWITSRGEAPTGKPVMVFVHGWGGSSRYWEATARVLCDRFDCLLYDLRGFGRSRGGVTSASSSKASLQAEYSVSTYADDLLNLLDELGLAQVWLHAHSMGTSIATVFLAQYPDRVERAILTCGGVFNYERLAFAMFHRFGGYVVSLRPAWLRKIPWANRVFMARFLHKALPDSESQSFLEDYLVADNNAALGTLYSAVSQQAAEDMPGCFAAIKTPTLLLSGEHDIIIPAKLGASAAKCNPTAIRYHVLPATAHFPMLEEPAAYQAEVDAFLAASIDDVGVMAVGMGVE